MESILRAAVAGEDLAALVEEHQRESRESFSEASDRLMISVAESFLSGRLTYADADQAANSWWRLFMYLCAEDSATPLPDLAYEIFLAIEQGEHVHSDGRNPVEQHTIPLLRAALHRPRDGADNER